MESRGSDLQDLGVFLTQLLKHRWVFLFVQFVFTLAVLASLTFLPRQYRSSTTIKVEREKVINPLTRGLAVTSQMEERLRTIRQEITSRGHVEKALTRSRLTGAATDPAGLEAMIARTKRGISVDMGETSRGVPESFKITYEGGEPRAVRDMTEALTEIFIEESLANKETEADSAFEFLRSQLSIYRGKLEESEKTLRLFEEQHMDELPSTRAVHLARLDLLAASIEEVRHNIRQLKIQKDFLIKRLPGEAGSGAPEDTVFIPNPLQAVLQEKQGNLRDLLQRFSEQYPDVKRLRAEIAELEAEIARNPTVPAGQVPSRSRSTSLEETLVTQLQGVDIELKTSQTREAQLEQEIQRYQRKVQNIPQVEQELSRLKRDYDVNSDLYEMFLRRLEEARVSRELEAAKKGEVFRVIEAAGLPLSPFRPRRLNVLLAGVALGLLANLVLVFVFRHRDTSLRDAAQAHSFTGLPVLACIPVVLSPAARARNAASHAAFFLTSILYAALLLGTVYWDRFQPILKTIIGGI